MRVETAADSMYSVRRTGSIGRFRGPGIGEPSSRRNANPVSWRDPFLFTYLHGTALVVHLVDAVHRLLRSAQQRREHSETHREQVGPWTRRRAIVYLVLARSSHASGLAQQHLHQHPQHVRPRETAAAALLFAARSSRVYPIDDDIGPTMSWLYEAIDTRGFTKKQDEALGC